MFVLNQKIQELKTAQEALNTEERDRIIDEILNENVIRGDVVNAIQQAGFTEAQQEITLDLYDRISTERTIERISANQRNRIVNETIEMFESKSVAGELRDGVIEKMCEFLNPQQLKEVQDYIDEIKSI